MDGNLSTLSRFINSACKVIIMGSLIRGEDNSEGLPLDEGIGLKKFPSTFKNEHITVSVWFQSNHPQI